MALRPNMLGLTHSWILYGLNEQSLKWESIRQVPSESMLESALKEYLMEGEPKSDIMAQYHILQQAYQAQALQNGLWPTAPSNPTVPKTKYKIFSFAKSTTNVEMTESFSAELTVNKTPIKGN